MKIWFSLVNQQILSWWFKTLLRKIDKKWLNIKEKGFSLDIIFSRRKYFMHSNIVNTSTVKKGTNICAALQHSIVLFLWKDIFKIMVDLNYRILINIFLNNWNITKYFLFGKKSLGKKNLWKVFTVIYFNNMRIKKNI